MTEPPEELRDDGGKWIRVDVLVKEMVDEGNEKEKVEESIREMMHEGPMQTKSMNDYEYVQLESMEAGIKYWTKYKAKLTKEKIGGAATRFLGGGN